MKVCPSHPTSYCHQRNQEREDGKGEGVKRSFLCCAQISRASHILSETSLLFEFNSAFEKLSKSYSINANDEE
jgi:hypothetical protein